MTLFATDTEDYMVCTKRYATNEILFRFNGQANLDYDGGVSPDDPMPTQWQILLDRVDKAESDVDGLSQSVSAMQRTVDDLSQSAVKNTDYASDNTGGVFKTSNSFATEVSNGYLLAQGKTYSQYESLNNNAFISKQTLENVITGKNLSPTVTLTQAEYDALTIKDANTYYYIPEEE